MICIRNIHKAYRAKEGFNHIFTDLSLQIEERDKIGILGRNGAGKSTLLRIIAGIEEPDRGKVIRKARLSWPIGFSGGFNGSLTGEENCHFVARIYGEPIPKIIDFVMSFAQLGQYFFMPFKTYSAGMKARLAFGLSMALEFDYYLIDEVTAVGDITFQQKCKQEFALRSQRSGMIMVSHNFNTLREYCNKIAILADGGITVYNDIEQAFTIYNKSVKNVI